MSKVRFTFNMLAVAIFTLTVVSMAQAQATRTWVSGVGDDANPCSRTAPCKTFAGAISKTAAAGEISVLDPGGFGGLTVTKSITVNGEGTLAGVLNASVNGFVINALTTDNVIIRNVSINAPNNGLDGIRILSAKTVTIENVTIAGQSSDGIEVLATNNVNVAITNTQIKNCTGSGIKADTSTGLVRMMIRNTNVSNCGVGVNPRRNSRVGMLDSTLAFNSIGLLVEGVGGSAVAVVKDSLIANNTSHGIQAGSATSTAASTARISSNLIHNNAGAGVSIQTQGVVDSFLNNEIIGNNPDGCAGCNNVSGSIN